MKSRMKLASVLLLVPGLFALVTVQAQQAVRASRPLLRPTQLTGTVKLQPDPTVIRSRNVIVDLELLRGKENRSLIVPLFEGKMLNILRDRQERTSKKGFVWYGHVANEPGSLAVLSVVGEVVIGNITTHKGKAFQIRYAGNRVHVLREIDQSKFPPEDCPVHPKPKPRGSEAADTCSTDPPSDIDVIVVYTATTRTAAGGTDAMEAEIYLALAETNQSYINSDIDQRIRLAHMEEVTYTESGTALTDVNRLQNGSDTFMDNVQTLRDTFAADVVVLVVESLGACGRAYDIMDPVSNAFESSAYAVVKRSCAAGNYSFAHELGHLMSARHDWCADSTNNSPYAYNHGYVDESPTSPATPWRTIMAYNNACSTGVNSTRLPYWSNPNINFPPGDPMGVATGSQQSDNHLTLNNTALTVANFRCSSPGANNVWMKDTWNDTGAEPDPLTAAEDMWKSPYIWVRNSQDTDLIHQHQHQNPEFGSSNWVYVKLHNGGGATAAGNLELYWANASTSLTWPAAWQLLTTIPVGSFASHSTRVVEAQWSDLPATGHYCMVARWVSASDPMTNAETSDIGYNVRYNNNIAWRNLNIVDLVSDSSSDATFIVRNVDKDLAAMWVVIRSPKNEIRNSFIRHGRLIVRFDEALMKAWRRGGSKGKGFNTELRSFVVTEPTGAVFGNILLDRRVVGHVKLTFKRLPTTPRRTFVIDAVQMKPPRTALTTPSRSWRVIGGISYEIHTDRVEQ